jgi:hypothetical protein
MTSKDGTRKKETRFATGNRYVRSIETRRRILEIENDEIN